MRRDLVLCLAGALLLRLLTCWWYSGHLTTDLDAYVGIARSVADGRGFSSPGSTVPTAYRPPLFPLLLAAVMQVVDVAWSVALVQIGCGLAAVAITWQLGRELGLGRYATVAATLMAVDPILLYFGTYPMTEVCCAFLTTAWCWFVVRSHHLDNTANPSQVVMLNLAGGAVFGLAALCRPTLWAVGGIYAGYLLVNRLRKQSMRRSAFAAHLLGIVIIVSPWVIRNQLVFGKSILTTTHGGYTLLLGNNPTFYDEVVNEPWGTVWNGESLAAWQQSLDDQMDAANIRGEIARDRWMSERAKAVIGEHPATFVKAGVKRLLWFWNPVPQRTAEMTVPSPLRCGVGVYYAAVTLLMFAGLVKSSERSSGWAVVIVTILGFTATHLVYWSNIRMRGPIVPLIALVAAAAVCRWIPAWSSRTQPSSVTPGGIRD